ncbi:MAG: helix-turn-helix transcriptional regulator [Crocosphaera sp.]|jgi:DNA-binding XRE family transcriptional regulator
MIYLLNWILRLKVGLGQWLLLKRRSLGLTQKQVAFELGVTSQTVSNWETSKAIPTLTIGQTKKLCQLLECQLDEIPSEEE